jgi:hypothetical protein
VRAAWAILLAIALAARPAHAEPSTERLVLIGAGLALPDYMLGVTIHESSHALAAEIVGASVDELHVFPPGRDPTAHVFRFGWTYVHGLRTDRQRALFYIAPKITDAILLGGYAALAYTSAWPSNRYGSLALTVFGTGLWIDFAKDVIPLARLDDVHQFFRVTCIRGWRRELPARLLYGAASIGLGVIVYRGYEHTFETPTPAATAAHVPFVLPVLQTAF